MSETVIIKFATNRSRIRGEMNREIVGGLAFAPSVGRTNAKLAVTGCGRSRPRRRNGERSHNSALRSVGESVKLSTRFGKNCEGGEQAPLIVAYNP